MISDVPSHGFRARRDGVVNVQVIAARIWEIQKRLHGHEPIKGYGRLLNGAIYHHAGDGALRYIGVTSFRTN
jgi:hypothetical protein